MIQSEVTLLAGATKLDLIMVFKLGLVIMITLASCIAHNGYSYVPSKLLSYDREIESYEDQESNNDGIPGVAGKDYPIFHQVPWTQFVCEWKYPGYYADPDADCQAYHICQRDGRKDSFLCPNGTLFNQERLVCTWWYTVDCSRAQSFYSINEAVAKAMEEADRRIRTDEQKQLSWSHQRDESNDLLSWNKNWQSEREWNKVSTQIEDLDFLKQFSYETPARLKFSAKSLSDANIHYDRYLSNYKSGIDFGKQSTLQNRPTFYLPPV